MRLDSFLTPVAVVVVVAAFCKMERQGGPASFLVGWSATYTRTQRP